MIDRKTGDTMHIKSAKLTFHVPHAQSLKDKRQVRRSLIDKAKGKFNASIAEVGALDAHQALILGIAVVSGEFSHAQNSLDEIVRFMEREAENSGLSELLEVAEICSE
ncbi:MAG: DUF503 domain-containing protein [Defluviitaleaceae bacterium]|nr:DUF503 domain-containing protein [Defluviitaleaceae bacterium]